MVSSEQVLGTLREIIDPDFNRNIVDLGFVRDLKINKNGNISFTINLTTPACPVKDFFKTEAQKKVLALEGVQKVDVRLTAVKTHTQSSKNAPSKDSGLQKVRTLIAVSSCKGGVGKSTVATLLARELVHRGFAVGLLDADIYGPSVPTLFGLHDVQLSFTADQKILPEVHEGLKLMSFGFVVKSEPSVMRGPMVSNYIQQLLHGVLWGELDYLIIDMPPGTGDIHLTITQSVSIDGTVIITTPHLLSLTDVGKGILMFEKVNVPVLGVIENMSTFFCEDNGKEYALFGQGAAQSLQERFGIEVLGKIPIQSSISDPLTSTTHPLLKPVVDNFIRSIGKASLKVELPPHLYHDFQKIVFTWEQTSKILSFENRVLRYYCNSAVNVDERTGKRLVQWEDIPENIQATVIKHLGNYAVVITWTDSHRSIFPYDYLNSLHKQLQKAF